MGRIIFTFTIFLSLTVNAFDPVAEGYNEYDPIKKIHRKIVPNTMFEYDEKIGFWNKRSTVIKHKARTIEKEIYDVTYTLDEHGRRIIPEQHLQNKSKFLVLMGDSYIFGEGVKDNETLPYHLSTMAPDMMVYNYGLRGSGPHQFLAMAQSGKLSSGIDLDEGIFIFSIADFHIQRANCHMLECNWLDRSPYYILNKKGKVERKGNFLSGRKWTTWFYERLRNKIKLADWTGRNFPWISQSDVELTCAIVKELERVLTSQFKKASFHVLLHPMVHTKKVLECLKKKKLNLITLSYQHSQSYVLQHDGHPTNAGHNQIAKLLIASLE